MTLIWLVFVAVAEAAGAGAARRRPWQVRVGMLGLSFVLWHAVAYSAGRLGGIAGWSDAAGMALGGGMLALVMVLIGRLVRRKNTDAVPRSLVKDVAFVVCLGVTFWVVGAG